MKSKANLFLFGSVVLILLAMGLVAILNKTSPKNSSTDVRARAGTQYALKLVGTVRAVNESKGTIEVAGARFADTNRSGESKDLGNWTVTAPPAFNFGSVSPGAAVTIGVNSNTFNISSHTVTAVTLTAGN